MPALSIPKSDRLGLAVLRRMPDDVLHELLLEINRAPGSVLSIKNLSPNETKQVMDAINSMYRVRWQNEVSLEEFISDICEALLEYNELKQNEEQLFRERLTKVLNVEALNVIAKALVLSTEHEHLFCSARILTDARPIYMGNVSDSPDKMVITHILKIEYHDAAKHMNEIYIGLGANDINELRNVLDRAEEKAKSLQVAFKTSKIKFIDPKYK